MTPSSNALTRLAALRARAASNPDDSRWVGYSLQEQAELEAYAELAEVSAQWCALARAERDRLRTELDHDREPDTQRTPPSAPVTEDPIPLVTVRRPGANGPRARRFVEFGAWLRRLPRIPTPQRSGPAPTWRR